MQRYHVVAMNSRGKTCDINYRPMLWIFEEFSENVLTEIRLMFGDICLGEDSMIDRCYIQYTSGTHRRRTAHAMSDKN